VAGRRHARRTSCSSSCTASSDAPRRPTAGRPTQRLVEKLKVRPDLEIEVLSAEDVRALVRAAANETDGALFLTAAFTGCDGAS
jgi:hypothetical protein